MNKDEENIECDNCGGFLVGLSAATISDDGKTIDARYCSWGCALTANSV